MKRSARPVELFVDVQQDPWDTAAGSTAELNGDLIEALLQGPVEEINEVSAALALLNLADIEMRAYGTDGSNELADLQIALVLRAARAVCERVGVQVAVPFRNFTGFRSFWNREGASGSWQARRDLIDELFSGAFRELEQLDILPRGRRIPEASLANLSDSAGILEQLRRIQRAIVDDPALAVGSAKELIESTAKVVLTERGLVVDDKADLPSLVKEAQRALALHPGSAAPGPDGTRSRRSWEGRRVSPSA